MGAYRIVSLVCLGVAAAAVAPQAQARDCTARVEGSRAGSFDISCLRGAEIKIGEGLVTIPPECTFDGTNDPTNPAYVIFQQFDFFKVGLADDGLGGADNWQVSQGRASGSTVYTCRP